MRLMRLMRIGDAGFDPPIWLQPADVMEAGSTGLGTQRQRVLAPR